MRLPAVEKGRCSPVLTGVEGLSADRVLLPLVKGLGGASDSVLYMSESTVGSFQASLAPVLLVFVMLSVSLMPKVFPTVFFLGKTKFFNGFSFCFFNNSWIFSLYSSSNIYLTVASPLGDRVSAL